MSGNIGAYNDSYLFSERIKRFIVNIMLIELALACLKEHDVI